MHNAAAGYLQLVTNRDRLRAELEKAEATLFVAAQNFDAHLDGEEDERVVAARAACRRIRGEFDRLERLVEDTMPPGRIESLRAELLGLRVDELGPAAAPRVRDTDATDTMGAGSAAATSSQVTARSMRWIDARLKLVVLRHGPVIRQSLWLLVLVLAYLAYYWIDVQLTIMKLPSVFLNPELSQITFGSLRLV